VSQTVGATDASLRKRNIVHCFDCDQACCKTAVVEVDPPRSLRGYSDLLFYLYHKDTQIVAVKGNGKIHWYVEFLSPCRNLANGRCSIYPWRPEVCREYDVRHCERNTRRAITCMKKPSDFYAFLRQEGRTRALERLLATHKPK